FAIPVTGANKRRLEALKQRRAEREAHDLHSMTELSKSISKLTCVVTAKTGEDGKMFGAVTNGAIADQLKTQFDIALDKKKIHLEKPIKTLGEHEVELRLHPEVVTTMKVRVESTNPVAATAAAVPAEETKEKDHRKTESRAHRAEKSAPAGKEKKTAKVEKSGKEEKTERKPRPTKSEK
ncbi:MAG: 50S ribosomal protein L9, partial [Verrucomicrobiota bacterium]|nr:50S ribosomal protein L9 [Verrucomicrobiota bacterium]